MQCLEEQCAYALSWGMPYELFWNGPLSAFNQYVEKARLDRLRKDREAWALGIYVTDAIAQTLSSKKGPSNIYPKEPYLEKAEREEKQTQEDKVIDIYKRLKNFSAGVAARIKIAPSE